MVVWDNPRFLILSVFRVIRISPPWSGAIRVGETSAVIYSGRCIMTGWIVSPVVFRIWIVSVGDVPLLTSSNSTVCLSVLMFPIVYGYEPL